MRGESGVESSAPAERMRALAEATKAFAERVVDHDQLLQTIAEKTGHLLGGYCSVGLVSDERSGWQPRAEYLPDPACAAVTVAGRDAQRAALCAPMRAKDVVLGTLAVERVGESGPAFADADAELLQMLADHAAQALDNARLLAAARGELREHRRTRQALERAEEKVRELSKLDAIGRLAGGVVHDFNNLLAVVLGSSDCLLETLEQGAPMREDIEQIHAAGVRAMALARRLLVSTRSELVPRAVDLNQVVAGMRPMLQRLAGENVELGLTLTGDLQRCRVGTEEVERVLMNLVANARDAMPAGGRVSIETARLLLDEAMAQAHPGAQPGPHAELSVTDTGRGMSAATLSRIFEPLFTTKTQGTGLGLATVYGIVQRCGGAVWVSSEPGQGATFKVLLPLALEAAGEVLAPGQERLLAGPSSGAPDGALEPRLAVAKRPPPERCGLGPRMPWTA